LRSEKAGCRGLAMLESGFTAGKFSIDFFLQKAGNQARGENIKIKVVKGGGLW